MDLRNNTISSVIGKDAADFTLDDMMSFITDNGIDMLNFMYPAGDGRLKTLNFTIDSEDYLYSVLTNGERVDGSSLFSFIEAGNSDLYVVPRLSTAFIDPFEERMTICFLCAFFDKDGRRLEYSPEYTLYKAKRTFKEKTGMDFEAMAELEYYVAAPEDQSGGLFPAQDQKGYHESAPFSRFNSFRAQCMHMITSAGGKIKYGHSEVGNFRLEGKIYEQNEIEFLPTDIEKAADSIMLAKWIIRSHAFRNGLEVSFAPKITEGKAGSGLHIHMRLMKDGQNMLLDPERKISDIARRAIAGLMELAPSITAFGNANPTSYLRLVPHQEAPTNICWGDRNRSVLVRIPLGWTSGRDMFSEINPARNADGNTSARKRKAAPDPSVKQTMEIRSADSSADIYLLLSAISIACRYGLGLENALETAGKTYVDVDIHRTENKAKADALDHLPSSCAESAEKLRQHRHIYEADGIFHPAMTEGIISRLLSYKDADLRERLRKEPGLEAALVRQYYWC